jgi:hypothetical protein
MSDQYQELGNASKEHERCRTQATSVSAVAEMKAWYERQCPTELIAGLSTSDLQSFYLPSKSMSKHLSNTLY